MTRGLLWFPAGFKRRNESIPEYQLSSSCADRDHKVATRNFESGKEQSLRASSECWLIARYFALDQIDLQYTRIIDKLRHSWPGSAFWSVAVYEPSPIISQSIYESLSGCTYVNNGTRIIGSVQFCGTHSPSEQIMGAPTLHSRCFYTGKVQAQVLEHNVTWFGVGMTAYLRY